MENKKQHYFFLVILFVVAILAVYIFYPYFTALLLALVFGVIFRPLHRGVSKVFSKGNQASSISAFITMIIVTILVITPLIFVGKQIYNETGNLYYNLTEEGQRSEFVSTLNTFSQSLSNKTFNIIPAYSFDSFNLTTYIQNFSDWFFANLDTIFSSVTRLGFQIFIMLFALFYLLRDVGKLKKEIIAMSPLVDDYDEKIFSKIRQTIKSVVAGSLVVSLVQGLLTGVGFYVFGIPDPALWGSFAVVAALIPGLGTSLINIPGALYLLIFAKTPFQAFGLLVWAFVAVGLIDNYIGPMLVNRGVKLHPFVILLSVISGLAFFGPIGFIAGPLLVALLFALLDIYKNTRI